jgi:hypothetical protein
METAKDISDNLIHRAKHLKEFTVFRSLDVVPFKGGRIPFGIQHNVGYPIEFTVPALTQEEAEIQVDKWLEDQDD